MKLPFPRSFKAWLVALVSLAAVAVVSMAPMMRPRAQAPPTAHTITDLGAPGFGGTESKAFGINSCGQVAGYATNGSSAKRPFFRPSSSLIDLLASGDGIATGVNNSGYVVGYSPTAGSYRAFIWHDDNGNNANDVNELKQLLPLGATGYAEDINDNGRVVGWIDDDGGAATTGGFAGFTWDANQTPNFQLISSSNSLKAYGINNAGTIVGEYSNPTSGFILRSGVFTDIGVFPNANNTGRSAAYAVSELDHVVGEAAADASSASPPMHAFIWTDAGLTPGLKDLGTLAGKTHSAAYNVAIVNGSPQVVGTSYNASSDERAFVWQDLNGDGDGVGEPTEMKDLNGLISASDQADWTLQQARSINSSGQIVGFGIKNGQTHAFLLTPPNVSPSPCLPNVSVSVSPAAVNEDGAGSLTYTFTRSITTGSALVVNFSTTGTADSSDYTISSPAGTVTIPANQQSATVTVDPVTDSSFEPNETVVLTTSPNAAYTVAAAPFNAATGTITNDDGLNVSVAVSPTATAEDGATDLVYTFTRNSTSGSLTVNFTVAGTATLNTDYIQTGAVSFTETAGTVSFANGSSTTTVTVNPTTDTTVETDETVILTVASGSGYTVGSPSTATGTITNDDVPNVSVAVSPTATAEDGATNLVYTFTRSSTIGSLTVNFSVGGTATAGTDYSQTGAATFPPSAATVNFANGSNIATVTVNPTTDTTVETDETVILTVTSGSGYTVGSPSAATGTITNDDVPNVSVAVSPAATAEDGLPNLVYTFTRSSTIGSLTVNFTVGGGSNPATFSSDYSQTGAATFSATSGTVTFSAGNPTEAVTLNPTADATVESDETVVLTISPNAAYTIAAAPANAATGTITNDDTTVGVTVSPTSVSEDGGSNLVYSFTRSGVTSGLLTVNFSVGGSATFSSDYAQTGAATFSASAGSVTLSAGSSSASVTVDPIADSTLESNETVILTVATGSGYTIGAPSVATGTIINGSIPIVSVAVSSPSPPSSPSVDEDGATDLVYTFTRSSTAGTLTVNYSVSGTATPGNDYSAPFISATGLVTFADGAPMATVTVNPIPDTTDELDETVILTISPDAAYTIAGNAATGTIKDDDLPNVSVAVSPTSPPGIAEDGLSNLVYTFTRSSTIGSPTVHFSIAGTATLNTDYSQTGASVTPPTNTTGTITFASGSSTATVTVTPIADTTDEPDETVILTISANAAYTIAASPQNTASGTINDNDNSPEIRITNVTAPEPSPGPSLFVFTVSLTNPSSTTITVNYATDTNGTATGGANCGTAGVDFISTSSPAPVTFSPGDTSKQVTIQVCGDGLLEPDETFFVNLSGNSANSVLPANTRGTGTITPQAPFVFTEEGNGTFAVAVDSVNFVRGPFRLTNDFNFSTDRLTRVILFTSPLGMTDADLATPNPLSVHINGYGALHIEHVGPVTGVFGLNASYIIVKLPADLPNSPTGPTNLILTVKMGSAESNLTLLSIIP